MIHFFKVIWPPATYKTPYSAFLLYHSMHTAAIINAFLLGKKKNICRVSYPKKRVGFWWFCKDIISNPVSGLCESLILPCSAFGILLFIQGLVFHTHVYIGY